MIYFIGMFMNTEAKGMYQGLVKGAKLCLNPYFLAGWRSELAGWRRELAGCRSTLSMSKIKVKISETKFLSFNKTLIWYVYFQLQFDLT